MRTDLNPKELAALIWVRDGLMSGKIPKEKFNMAVVGDCGSIGCIGGWMAHRLKKANPECWMLNNAKFRRLFYPPGDVMFEAGTADAAKAIDNFLQDNANPWRFMEVDA